MFQTCYQKKKISLLMETLVLKNITLKKKKTTILEPLEFDVEMKCNEEIKDGVVFTVVYNVNVKTDKDDQILSEIEIAPIPRGNVKFSLEADAPDLDKIPHDQKFGLTSIIIIGSYNDQQFIRIGYIVDIYYPGIPNDELVSNELYDEVEYEEINEEDEEEEEEESEEGDQDIEGLVVDDSQEEQGETKTFNEALEEKIMNDVKKSQDENAKLEEQEEEVGEESASQIREELDKPVDARVELIDETTTVEDVFEYKGYSIDKAKIEMNIMEPPSVHTFLIQWREEEELEQLEEEPLVEQDETIKTDDSIKSKDSDEPSSKKMRIE